MPQGRRPRGAESCTATSVEAISRPTRGHSSPTRTCSPGAATSAPGAPRTARSAPTHRSPARTLGSLARGRRFCSSCWRLGDRAAGSETVDHTTGALGRCASRDPGWRRVSLVPTRSHPAVPSCRSPGIIWLTRALSAARPRGFEPLTFGSVDRGSEAYIWLYRAKPCPTSRQKVAKKSISRPFWARRPHAATRARNPRAGALLAGNVSGRASAQPAAGTRIASRVVSLGSVISSSATSS